MPKNTFYVFLVSILFVVVRFLPGVEFRGPQTTGYSRLHDELIHKFNRVVEEGIVTEQQYYENYVNRRVPTVVQEREPPANLHFVNCFAGEIPAKPHDLGHVLVQTRDRNSIPLAKSLAQWQRGFTTRLKWRHSYAITLAFTHKLLRMGFTNPLIPFSWHDWCDLHNTVGSTESPELGERIHVPVFRQDPSEFLAFHESEATKIARGTKYVSSDRVPVEKMVFVSKDRNIEMAVKTVAASKSAIFDPEFGILHELAALEGIGRSNVQAHGVNLTHVRNEVFGIPEMAYFDNRRAQLVVSSRARDLASGSRDLQFAEYLSLPRLETRANNGYTGPNGMTIVLYSDDFRLSAPDRIRDLSRPRSSYYYKDRILSPEDFAYLDLVASKHCQSLLQSSRQLEDLQKHKLLSDLTLSGNTAPIGLPGSHHDGRFFKGVLLESEKLESLHRLARAWQTFAANEKVIYWLSHGNLLSWKWQGTNFAWDHNVDVQLPIRHLEYLAANFNNSVIVFEDEDYVGRYYLEIGPLFNVQAKEGHKNIIDGRLIDVDTGHYVALVSVFSAEDTGVQKQHTGQGAKALKSSFKNFYGGAVALTDKNSYSYPSLASLSPLRRTVYEGISTYVPFDVDRILTDEYPYGLQDTDNGYFRYDEHLCGWISKTCGNCVSKETEKLWKDHERESHATCKHNIEGEERYCKPPGSTTLHFRWPNVKTNSLERHSRYHEMNGYPYV